MMDRYKKCRGVAMLVLVLGLAAESPAAAQDAAAPLVVEGKSFHDDFSRPNTTRWFRANGWRNGDYQSCTWSRNEAVVKGGALEMGMRASWSGEEFTCAEVSSTQSFAYGLYEVSMRPSKLSGVLTAMFTYAGPGDGLEAQSGIDIAFLGRDTTKLQISHVANGEPKATVLIDLGFDAADGYNTYAFEWKEDRITWFVNGEKVHETAVDEPIPSAPARMYLTLWSGSADISEWIGPFVFPEKRPTASIDWVAFSRQGEPCRFEGSLTCER